MNGQIGLLQKELALENIGLPPGLQIGYLHTGFGNQLQNAFLPDRSLAHAPRLPQTQNSVINRKLLGCKAEIKAAPPLYVQHCEQQGETEQGSLAGLELFHRHPVEIQFQLLHPNYYFKADSHKAALLIDTVHNGVEQLHHFPNLPHLLINSRGVHEVEVVEIELLPNLLAQVALQYFVNNYLAQLTHLKIGDGQDAPVAYFDEF